MADPTTPEEFAEAHGLSVEEATYILSRRATLAASVVEAGGREVTNLAETKGRLEIAMSVLAGAQRKVGVHPVTIHKGVIEVTPDPEADEGRLRFYDADKLRRKVDRTGWTSAVRPSSNQPLAQTIGEVDVWDVSQDPEDY